MRTVLLMGVLMVMAPDVSRAQQAVAVDNLEIRMVRTSDGDPLRVTADTRNPNDFAMRDVLFNCSIKDRAGKELASYTSTIYENFPANSKKVTTNLNVGAWPPDGFAALCLSVRGVKVAAKPAG